MGESMQVNGGHRAFYICHFCSYAIESMYVEGRAGIQCELSQMRGG
jgi:hypothetical protein